MYLRQFLLPFVIALVPMSVSATTIDVPGSYSTIQAAINASADGDTVLVHPGTYFENIDFAGHDIVLGSLFLTTGDEAHVAATIIDGNAAGSVVTLGSEDTATQIVGLTLRNGAAADGGGLYFDGSGLTLRKLVITGNQATGTGGGLCLYALFTAQVVVTDCLIENNTSQGDGGGVYAYRAVAGGFEFTGCTLDGNQAVGKGGGMCSDGHTTVTNCDFTNNTLYSAGGGQWLGGGFYGGNYGSILDGCLFSGNTAPFGGGLAFYLSSSSTSVNACTIINNTGLGGGGGIWFDNATGSAINHGSITECAIMDNQTDVIGGGIGIQQGTGITVENCLIANNSAITAGGIFVLDVEDVHFEHCTVVGNEASNAAGGIMVRTGSSYTNCIVEGNTSPDVGGIDFSWGEGSFLYGDVVNNLPSDFGGSPPAGFGAPVTVNANGDPCDVYGNIVLDPLFCAEEDEDFRIAQESPCIGAGQEGTDIGALGPGCTFSAVGDSAPRFLVLLPNFPNPCNPGTTIRFRLADRSRAMLTVYDVLGRKVRSLADAEMPAGTHEVSWNGRDARGKSLASGTYIVRLETDKGVASRKVTLIR